MQIPDYSRLFRDGLEIPTSYGIARLKRHNIGELVVPTGNIVACDPFVFSESPAFTLQLAPGRYPVILNVATFDTDQRVAYAALKIAEGEPQHWEMALLPGQDVSSLEADHFFCYGVDSGTGSLMDVLAAQALTKKMDADEDYFQTLIAELDKTYVHTWSWANVEMDPDTHANLITFSSGWGDGCYGSYFGFDEAHNPLLLVTDFGVFVDEEIAEVLS